MMELDPLRVLEDLRGSRKLLGAFNSTFLTLISKKDNSYSFDDLMPIAFSTCIYKIISKIIVR